MTWKSVRPGGYIYEIGDHGALIVIADHQKPVNGIEFSWDEGATWTYLKVSEQPFWVQNIIIEPNSLSQQFILYGFYDEEAKAADDFDIETEIGESKAFLTYLDFSSIHQRACEGVDNPGSSKSDYETWTPNDGRHNSDNKCYLG